MTHCGLSSTMNKAVFFDRDGVLNKLVEREGGLYSPRDVKRFDLFPDNSKVISSVKSKGYLSIVVSNQPDVSRGLLKNSDLDKMTNILFDSLQVDDVFYCLHDDPDEEGCRKPAPGLILKAQKKWDIELKKSLMIGDTEKDLKAAKNAGVRFLLLDRTYNHSINTKNRINNLAGVLKYLN